MPAVEQHKSKQVAQLWLTDRATAYIQKVRCAVVGTVNGSVQGRPGTRDAVAIHWARKTRTDWPGWHNNLNRYAPGRPAQNISVCRGVGVLRRRWVTFGKYLTRKGASPNNQCWFQKTSDCHFVWYQNICSASFSLITIHASDR